MSEWFSAHYQKFISDFSQSFIEDSRWLYIVKGLRVTVTVAVCALILGVIIGIIVAVIRSAHDQKRSGKKGFGSVILGLFDFICRVYLTVIRGTPMMVQLLIMYFVIFASTTNTELVAIMAFGINSGAYVAEIIRGGIMSIDAGQMEAGRSLGLNYVKTMRYIIIPQAIKNILPALGNEMITLLKDTSLVTVIGLKDMVKGALIIQGRTYQAFMPLVTVAIIYLVLVVILSKLLSMFERRMRESDRR
ncbi:amino acid ABC transporter permease [Lachnospiraceae bacterium NSJ-143]|nr:amino acid ABC transporter permease [Lachnospiraceae bacterium NSJ-143]